MTPPPAALAPTVAAVAPVGNSTAVPVNTRVIAAAFSMPMDAATLTATSFTLACPAQSPIVGTVSYLAATNSATLTLPSTATLPATTACTATVTTAAKSAAGVALASNFVWTFTTGAAPDTAAPTVSSTAPLAGAAGVAFNSRVTASFSEPMDPLTITTSTFALACPGGAAVAGTVAYAVNGNVATFTPAANLPAGATCTATVATGARDVAGNALASPFTWTFSTGAAPDTAAPTIVGVVPPTGTTGVAISTAVTASFSEAMDPLTVNTASFTLACPAGVAVAGTVGYAVNGSVATFTPNVDLPTSTTCTATVGTGAKDLAGNALASPVAWTFTTSAAPDTTAPTVASTAPLPGATGVASNTHVAASFSEAMDPLTISTATTTLSCGVSAIAGTVGYAVAGNVATFTPTASLPASTTCAATINTGAKDLSGNALVTPFVWSFTTGAAPDTSAPTVSSTGPAPGATGVAFNSRVTASFSEAMDPLTVGASSFALSCPGNTPVAGTVGYAVSGNVATFTPNANLPASTICTATVGTGAKDLAGNALASPVTWTFTTGTAPDTIAPTVASTAPLPGATGVASNLRVTASFSEPIDPLTIGTATFALTCPGNTAVAGTVGYAASGNVATFTPTASLPAGSVCTATVTTGVKDLAGNTLASPFSWSFSTGVAPDTTAPTVASTGPAPGATGVAFNTRVTASFSEAMDPLTIGSSSFSLACPGGTPVAGTVAYAVSGNVATFSPTENLPAGTTCTATVGTGAKDLAGNALASPVIWSFTTGAAPDTTAPTVASTAPLPGATGVASNSRVTASFSEALDPLTIGTATFGLTCPGNTAVAGTVGYAASGNVATFTPTSSLPAGSVCTATVTTGVKDLAGNALASPFSWSFATGAAPDTTAPTVASTGPEPGATGVAFNTRVTASFSEAMDPLTIGASSFSLACPAGTPVAGTVAYAVSGNVATFTPSTGLPAGTTCTATVGTGAKDLAGNALASPVTWSFTTGAAPDTTAPTVASTAPAPEASGVAFNARVTASFSEAMDPLTISTATFALTCPGNTVVTGTVGYAASVATFTPTANLPAASTCTATVTSGVKDLAGNALASPYVWTFTTGAAPDTTPPTVSSTAPIPGTTGVAFNTVVTASFSEPIDPVTIGPAAFTLACPGGTPVAGTVGYATTGNVATFTPTADLPASTICTATITTAVKDLAGNALASPFVWSFTTGAAPDTTPPTVASTAPPAGAVNVAINSLVTATFSEAMDPPTISTASFTLACPDETSVAGTVDYAVSGNVATFRPTGSLPASTTCTARITPAATDLAGNALATAFVWTFTTGAAPDTTPPTVLGTNPADAAVGVCVNKTINATFSEPMNPLSITTATFTLAPTAGLPVTGVVTYDSLTNIASFRPSANLIGTPATLYTVTIKGGVSGVKDQAGNPLVVDRVTTFTTNASTCVAAPVLGAASTFGAFGGNASLTNDGVGTVILGDVGVNAVSTSVTGLRDTGGQVYTITPDNNGLVSGTVYTTSTGSPPGDAVRAARGDALLAFNSISPGNLPGGIDVSNAAQCPSCGGLLGGTDELAGRTLPPGVYLSAAGTYDIGGASRTIGNLTLDGGGDANAVWVFQTTAGTGRVDVGLTGPATPATPIQVLLINGAQAKNVFWYAPAGATIGTGSTMTGTILSDATITMSTTGTPPSAVTTTLNGRAIALTAGVTMVNTHINTPPP